MALLVLVSGGVVACFVQNACAQECTQDHDIEPATYAIVTAAARQYLDTSAQGDIAALRTNVAPAAESSLPAIGAAIQQHRAELKGTASIKRVYLLTQPAGDAGKSGEFYCGVFGANGHTSDSASFRIPSLAPGRYAIVFQQIANADSSLSLALVLQETGPSGSTGAASWKIAGYYLKPSSVNGHDGEWFGAQAKDAKKKGNNYLAWLYDYMAWELQAPVNFMSALELDRLSADVQTLSAPDLPASSPVTFTAAGKSYKLTQIFPLVDGGKLDLVVKYEVADLTNTAAVAKANAELIHAIVAAHPELRDQFQTMVVRAVTPGGGDYGTVMAMGEVK
jgi:hypothetical protein